MGDDRATTASTSLIRDGSALAGAATGGALGLIGGPAGVIGGAVAGVALNQVLTRVGLEIHERILGPRQRVRAGAAYAMALDEIRARIMNGDQPRHDFFGDERPSTGEEFLDGVLLRASDSYEERKVPYLARLYASTLFDDSVSASYAHLLLKQIERTTYNQLVLLALSADESLKGGFIHEGRVRRDHELYVSMGRAIGAELMELGLMGLVARARAGGLAPLVGLYDLEVWEDLREYRIRVTPEGADLHRLSGLDRIPRDELEQANDDLGHEVVG